MKRPVLKTEPRQVKPPTTRPPLERMQKIFHTIKLGKYPNRDQLALENEVTTRTIQRDLTFMQDRFSLPISYNNQKQGFEFTEEVEGFPLVDLCESELVSVYVAQKALQQYQGTPFEHPLRSAFAKLISGLEGKITLSWDDLDSFISFRSFAIVPTDLKVFQIVSEAVRKNAVLEFEYKKLNASVFQNGRWSRTIWPVSRTSGTALAGIFSAAPYAPLFSPGCVQLWGRDRHFHIAGNLS